MLQGQSIILPGVSSAGAGQVSNQMSSGDLAAAQIRDMISCFMAEAAIPQAAGGISGYDVANSGLLLPNGTGAASISRTDSDAQFGSRASVSMVQNSAIDLPAGSAGGLKSYTAVLVLSQTAAGLAEAVQNRFVSLIGADGAAVAYSLARGGSGLASPGMYLSPYGITSADRLYVPASSVALPAADVTSVYVLDWNNDSRLVRMAINTPTVLAQGTLAASFTAPTAAGAYWRLGWPSMNAFKGRIARAYMWPRSLMSTTVGQRQLTTLLAALRSTYGISV